MEKIVSKVFCTGCGCCCNICPKGAISMISDNNGFKYPVIDHEKCINCGLCKKRCPIFLGKNKTLNECYAAYNTDDHVLMSSSSGGIFYQLASLVLEDNGIVIGAAFDNNQKLVHTIATNKNDMLKLMGSKYLQSDLKKIYKIIKETLTNKKVLFVGTPCQVAGLKSYIGSENPNLICVDLICHGVPSIKLFEKYVEELQISNSDVLNKYNFRDKSTGWDNYSVSIKFGNSSKKELSTNNSYMKLYLSNLALRESCYNCNFKLGNKYSDITLGDYWGIQNFHKDMYNKKGVSAVIINTKKGAEVFDKIKNNIIYRKTSLNDIVSGNPCLKKSCDIPLKREMFFEDMKNYSCNELCKKYCKIPLYKKIIMKLKSIIKTIIHKN